MTFWSVFGIASRKSQYNFTDCFWSYWHKMFIIVGFMLFIYFVESFFTSLSVCFSYSGSFILYFRFIRISVLRKACATHKRALWNSLKHIHTMMWKSCTYVKERTVELCALRSHLYIDTLTHTNATEHLPHTTRTYSHIHTEWVFSAWLLCVVVFSKSVWRTLDSYAGACSTITTITMQYKRSK